MLSAVNPQTIPIVHSALKTANWDSLFDNYKVKITTLIYNIYNRITPPCLEHIIQRIEFKYDLRHQHRVNVQRFETYYMKYSISYRGSIHILTCSVDGFTRRVTLKQRHKALRKRPIEFTNE